MTTLHFETALLPDGWADGVSVDVADDGTITGVRTGEAGAPTVRGIALPGMPNLHSHAFQRAMAGLGERSGPGAQGEADSFWTWRSVMYGFVERLTPDDLGAIARKLYIDMLKAGYTSVAEFHYLHHDPAGTPYSSRAEMSFRTVEAAIETGIGITQLPVLYANGGFGGQSPSEGQRRFINDADGIVEIVYGLTHRYANHPQVAIGLAPHSLRAVEPKLLAWAVGRMTDTAPIHIHIAEQTREVEECVAWSGARPVRWLLDNADVNAHWCLVHATHMDQAETADLARSGAVAGLCPTTEANLGDGLFPAAEYMSAGGRWGIGSDSHISVSVKEELRWFEYGQRLQRRQRNVLAGGPDRSTGRALYDGALKGGAQACARPIGAIAPRRRADIVVLDGDRTPLAGLRGDAVLDAWLFACDGNPVRDVFAGGTHVVVDGRHELDETAEAGMQAVVQRLTEDR